MIEYLGNTEYIRSNLLGMAELQANQCVDDMTYPLGVLLEQFNLTKQRLPRSFSYRQMDDGPSETETRL